MQRTNLTPPMLQVDGIENMYRQPGSATTSGSSDFENCSPHSVITAATTPPTASPNRYRDCGPMLLPRVRTQDQATEHVSLARPSGHSRTQSLPNNNGYPMTFGAQLQIPQNYQFQPNYNYTSSPYDETAVTTSATSPYAPYMVNPFTQQSSSMYQSVSATTTPVRSHSRNLSTSSVDPASIPDRFLRPTYRVSPGPQTNGMAMPPNAMSHLLPMAGMGNVSAQNYPARRRQPSPVSRPAKIVEVEETMGPAVETSLAQYLSKSNPALRIVPQENVGFTPNPGQDGVFWFDVRQVLTWSDFTIDIISSFKGLPDLLHFPATLAEPLRSSITKPESRDQLAELCVKHHLQKLNVALAFSQGEHHLSARRPTRSAASLPDFISNHASDTDATVTGERRGRVIGLARCYNEWNTGMRNGKEPQQVQYLTGLAALHQHMRNHRCRYGYIMTEIELVCVRIGGMGDSEGIPYFGHVEIAIIPMSAEGLDKSGKMQMTADLALWYLHMLARDQVLPGQLEWQLHLGGPAACSRRIALERDAWMPAVMMKDSRAAKRSRKWVKPEDPITSIETGRARKRARISE